MTFALYEEERGGAPLWMETQNVQADGSGRYTALLGATRNDGIPAEVFASGQGRWLGVQPQGEIERPRVLMASVPYALKAVDAETLGGLPASAFALAGTANHGTAKGEVTESAAGSGKSVQQDSSSTPDLTGSGTANYITMWTAATVFGNSKLYQTASGNVGLGTTTPTAKLEAITASVTGTGVLGYASSATGANVGVTGKTLSSTGTGVLGEATATSGANLGVSGVSASINGSGVSGVNSATSGYTSGVYGSAASPNGIGVLGYTAASGGTGVNGTSSATAGSATGVWGQSDSTSGNGVVGTNTATAGSGNGVYGQSASTAGNGVVGTNIATSGYTAGVNGQSASPSGAGVSGQNLSASGGNGVFGQSNAASGYGNGGYFQTTSPGGNGVVGFAMPRQATTAVWPAPTPARTAAA